MRRRSLLPCLSLLLLLTAAVAQPAKPSTTSHASSAEAAELPVRRVVLYKNGVGYFEHQGRVTGNQELNIRFTTSQLNDVLKSLTVVDLGGGQVSGVRYNSVAPLSQRLSTLRLALDGNTDRASFLNALRGARVEVRSGTASAIGKLLSIEEVTRQDKDGNELKSTQLSLVSDAGELRSFEMNTATSVKILDGEMTREVGRYMALLASARDKDVRQMTIATSGSGTRDVLVSYISEVPVWKSTYRIVLPKNKDAKPLLQGWAIVDNTVGEDWKDVQLSLVAGSPQSFVEQISQPYYVRRPVVELPKSAQLTPQTHEGAEYAEDKAPTGLGGVAGGMVAETLNAPAPMAKAARSRGVGSGSGGGIGGGVYHVGNSVATDQANALTESYEQSFQAQSNGEALGDMFQYAVHQPVTILQNQSALVPIVQARVDAEKVTLWNAHEQAPVRALWLTNSSGLTLDAGSFNIVEDGAFAGEGLLSEVHPNERRLVSYAADTAVRVKSQGANETRPYTHLRAAKGILTLTRELRETRTYTVTNTDIAPRTVVIEHPARAGWKFLDAATKPDETSNSYSRFRLAVAASSTQKLEVAEYFPQQTTYALSTVAPDVIQMVLSTRDVQPEVEASLRKLLAKKDEVSAAEQALKQRHEEVERIGQEQARLRENMQALKGSSEEKALVQRYVGELNKQEDRLEKLNAEISAKEVELSSLQGEYQHMAESVTFDQIR
ncbi:MAG: hypothetical protein P4M01_07140 [Acidobacteriota bacterium]|nr:hypothetical protein [Acidobacteriota bacterium]